MIAREKTLYIFLSDKCNFFCDHCSFNSGPKADRYMISDREIKKICQYVNTDSSISEIFFTGGEPTLQISKIQEIQDGIYREIKYAIITNGWFGGSKVDYIFDSITLDRIIISYDKFHARFISSYEINLVIEEALSRDIAVTINSAIDKLNDLIVIKDLRRIKVKPSIGLVNPSGRAINIEKKDICQKNNSAVLQEVCPGFDRYNKLKSLTYFPGKGLTFCCGPLLTNGLLNDSDLYSQIPGDFSESELFKKIEIGSFQKQLEHLKLRIENMPFRTCCELCATIYGKEANTSIPPSLDFITRKSSSYFFCYK